MFMSNPVLAGDTLFGMSHLSAGQFFALDAGSGTAIVVDDALDAQPRAEARAAAELRRSTLGSVRAELTALPHAGVELGDVVSVTDAALGLDAAPLRIAEITLRFARGRRGRYEMTLVLSER